MSAGSGGHFFMARSHAPKGGAPPLLRYKLRSFLLFAFCAERQIVTQIDQRLCLPAVCTAVQQNTDPMLFVHMVRGKNRLPVRDGSAGRRTGHRIGRASPSHIRSAAEGILHGGPSPHERKDLREERRRRSDGTSPEHPSQSSLEARDRRALEWRVQGIP